MRTSGRLSMRPSALAIALAALFLGVAACTPSGRANDPSPTNAPSATRADLFMHSVETGDGALGWRQLCPELQRNVSRDVLKAEANAQKAAEVGSVRRLRYDLVGTRPLKPAGQARVYLLTAD